MIHMHKNMNIKIITKEKAFKMGLTTKTTKMIGRGSPIYMYGVIGNSNDKKTRTSKKNNIYQKFRINLNTNKKEILYERQEYKRMLKNINIS